MREALREDRKSAVIPFICVLMTCISFQTNTKKKPIWLIQKHLNPANNGTCEGATEELNWEEVELQNKLVCPTAPSVNEL